MPWHLTLRIKAFDLQKKAGAPTAMSYRRAPHGAYDDATVMAEWSALALATADHAKGRQQE